MNHENPMEIDQDEIVLDQEIAEARLLKSSANSKTVFVPKVQNMDDYLIKHYKSVKRVETTDIQQLTSVIGTAKAQLVYNFFHPNEQETK